MTRRRSASAACAFDSALATRALASAAAHCWSGTGCRESTTPRTSRQISATGRPLFTASVMTWSPSLIAILAISPGRPRIRSDIDCLRSTVTYPGGSASLSDLVRTLA